MIRVAAATSHWLGTCLRFVPTISGWDALRKSVPELVKLAIGYE